MGRSKIPGIYPGEQRQGWQINARYQGECIRRRGFTSAKEAESFLISEKERIRKFKVVGPVQRRTFDEAAGHYVLREQARGKVSLATDIHLLKRVVAVIGEVQLDRISQATVQPFIDAARQDGLKSKSINNALGVVIRICNLAMRSWRDDNGMPWLGAAPMIQKLPLDDQRPPKPITWAQQRVLIPFLPPHLARMVQFDLQTGLRDEVVCQLRWEWERTVPLDDELSFSVFIVPRRYVKGRNAERVVVCNPVAQAIVDAQRGKHEEFVFVYGRET